MNDLPELHDITLTDLEKEYAQRAMKAGVQSIEMLHVLVLGRIINYNLKNLIGAMENPLFEVFRVTPEDVQKTYTIVKGALRNTVVVIPQEIRNDNNPEA